MTEKFHEPVMVEEVMKYLLARPRKVIADCTLGDGGHTKVVLSRTSGTFVVGMDVDSEALMVAGQRLRESYPGRFVAVKGDYRELPTVLAKLGIPAIDGALFDLGVSSRQLDTLERGFSYWGEGPLDMRMNQEGGMTAGDIVNSWSEEEISKILWEYGEERFSARISREIVRTREDRLLGTAKDLVDIVLRAYPGAARHGGPHPARRTFQALRIVTNDELSRLALAMERAADLVNHEGVLAVLTYHSLEDRIVKSSFKALVERGAGQRVQKKPETASEAEVAGNARSRSAKLRVVERTRQ
jgi:16S rRNA (cytosine1402-N4)-methyltransferase